MDLHKCYVAELYDQNIYTASVRIDNEKILSTAGYKALKFRHYRNNSLLTKFSRVINSIYFFIRCPRKSMVVFHFPFHATMYVFLQKLLKWKNVKTIAIIIDIEGLRNDDEILFMDEIKQLNKFDFIIAHNEAMKNKLAESMPDKKIYTILIFDYPLPLYQLPQRLFEKNICIAGNLKKSKFIYQLYKIKGIDFNLYGEGFNNPVPDKSGNVIYNGVFAPAELVNNLRGSFGLVWDGDIIDTCDSNTGKYLRYNNPYKLSLYIAAGLPVIAWKQSAIAAFIEENGIGFMVNSLFELEEKLQKITEADYMLMRQNIIPLSQQIRSGYFLKTALQKINDEL